MPQLLPEITECPILIMVAYFLSGNRNGPPTPEHGSVLAGLFLWPYFKIAFVDDEKVLVQIRYRNLTWVDVLPL